MTSTKNAKKKALWRISPLPFAIALALSVAPVWAQDEDIAEDAAEEVIESAEETAEEAADMDAIVVTGSRLQRQTYSSIAPMQVITAEGAREAGLINASEILQKSSFSSGQQIDLTFSGFVLDNGPGASTANLRGLGDSRTLLLMNGRRLAPSGVEGAPSAPDLNLIPGSLVQQYEVLLDGASSIYGSDAVAGVINLIMRRDFDGLEVDIFGSAPAEGGENYTANVTWGKNFDRGFIGFGASYNDTSAISREQGAFTSGCNENQEIDENGRRRTQDVFNPIVRGMPWDSCKRGSSSSWVIIPPSLGNALWYTPGTSNGAWGNFSDVFNGFVGWIDTNGDGISDVNYYDYQDNGKQNDRDLFPATDRLNVMAYGEYTFEGEMNNTVYFETNFADRNATIISGTPQLFPVVPANNPYNLCNPNAIGGVDCGLGQDALYTNPGFIDQFSAEFADFCASQGVPLEFCTPATFGLLPGAVGPVSTQPVVRVAGDRNNTTTEMQQMRVVAGIKGDLPFINFGSVNNWVYDTSFSWTESDGTSSRVGIRGDRLEYSLNNSVLVNGNVVCNGTAPNDNVPCVPINMFAPSLYPVGANIIGNFATQAERDYLFDSRDFRTKYTQTIFSAYMNGFMGELPAGPILAGAGFEWRNDDINSLPDNIARDGLFFGFFSDGGAVGDKDTTEFFGEIEFPLLAGVPFADELTLNLSGRYTDDEFYGSGTTGSAKLGWRPIPSLLLRATYGTSFRAPTVREVFLLDQTGFVNSSDPCVTPSNAFVTLPGEDPVYDPTLDQREPFVLENCRLNGVDPTNFANNGVSVYSTEIARGGSTSLEAETSDSFTYGFSFEQPWTDKFNFSFGATYYDITVNDTIVEPSGQFLINDCYFDQEFNSNSCGQVVRDLAGDGTIDLLQAGFINRDEQKVTGIDINVNYDQFFTILGGQGMTIAADLTLNHPMEASTTFTDDNGVENFNDNAGFWGYQDWKGVLALRAQVEKWTYAWTINFISSTETQFPDEFDEAITGISDTCVGPPTDVLCRDVDFGDDYFTHALSLTYTNDNWVVRGGVRNVFDQAPPLVDSSEVLSVNNAPIGVGYDLFGRTMFLNIIWRQ